MIDRGMTSEEIDSITYADMQRWMIHRNYKRDMQELTIARGIILAFKGGKK